MAGKAEFKASPAYAFLGEADLDPFDRLVATPRSDIAPSGRVTNSNGCTAHIGRMFAHDSALPRE